MEDYLNILRSEFDAEEGSFLLQLRCELVWDKEAFARLTNAMKICAEHSAVHEHLDRWVAEGFWYVPQFTRDWSGHPKFSRPTPDSYYQNALVRLDDLAYWYFHGNSPYQDGKGFGPLE